jgi:hypothetical protein
MPYPELLARAADTAPTPAAAARVVAALHDAGLVLRWRQTVFLRPAEVADMVLRALPDSDLEVRARLAELRAELAPLQSAKRSVDADAAARSRAVLWTGFAALAGQWATFCYLAWGSPHWGWEATEPWTWASTQLITVLGVGYVVWSRRSPDISSLDAHVRASFQKKKYVEAGVDVAAYDKLKADVARYEAYWARIRGDERGDVGGGAL